MKTIIWLALVLVLFLAGCAPAAYETPTRETETPWYLQNGIPPLPVPPEAG